MKKFTKFKKYALIAFMAFGFVSCNNDSATPTDTTITNLAVNTPNLSILVQALTKADLATTLKGNGSFTVFAPTNAAFTKFLSDNGYANLEAVPTAALKEILLNHVVSGAVKSTELVNNSYIKTLAKGASSATNTLSMYVNTTNGVLLNGVSKVTTSKDIIASNGVIHIVDAVIGLPTIVTHAGANANFSQLVSLLSTQGLVSTLGASTNSPFTVFAPVNTAFTPAILEVYGGLDSNKKTEVLKYHVVGGANVLANAIPSGNITTLQGQVFTITGTAIDDAGTTVNKKIIITDVQCSNGVIHAIDGVLLPKSN
jgi:uncharacterized surface protein with fasciclin (FAS1) repeats